MTQLIVALDVEPGPGSRAMVHDLVVAGVSWFKIGVPMLCNQEGMETARYVKEVNPEIGLMLDLKLYDTRDTVLRAVDAAIKMGVDMLTVHVSCTEHALGRGVDILAVGRLTDGTASVYGSSDHLVDHVLPFADGIICTAWQAMGLRPKTDKLLVCPGIRPIGAEGDNHAIPATPRDAAKFGADFIVVGRPIYNSPDPVEAAKNILREIDHGPV